MYTQPQYGGRHLFYLPCRFCSCYPREGPGRVKSYKAEIKKSFKKRKGLISQTGQIQGNIGLLSFCALDILFFERC